MFILVVNLDFWMTVFNKFARTFKSHWLLYLCVIVFGITNLVASSGAHMVQRLLFFVLTILVVKRISSLPLRLLVAAPFVLLTAADMSISSIHGVPLVQLSMMDLRLVCSRVIRMKLSKCWGCISLIYVPLLFIPSFLAVIIKYDVSLPTKK